MFLTGNVVIFARLRAKLTMIDGDGFKSVVFELSVWEGPGNMEGERVGCRSIEGLVNQYAERLGLRGPQTGGSVAGSGSAFIASVVESRLVERGLAGWIGEALAVSITGSIELRRYWQEQAAGGHPLDGQFTVGDLWGKLIAIESLIDSSLKGLEGGMTSNIEQMVGALVLSVVGLQEEFCHLARSRRVEPPPVIEVSTDSILAAQRSLLGDH